MLTPEYLETVGDEIGSLYDDVVTDILADMAERIRLAEDTMTATNEFLNQKLIDMGLQQKYINQRLAELQNTTEKKIEEVMTSSTYKSVRDSFERYRSAGYDPTGVELSRQVLKSTNVLKGELTNLTRTTAKLAQSTFIKSYDKAYLQVSSGAYSYDQACKNVIQDLTKNGIGTIEYYSGTKRTVESAVRLAVRTSVNQNALACEMEMLNDMDDVNLVETSSHVGARPEHAEWQGKVFWLKKPEPGYESFYAATGYGTGTGLGGYNCRHSFYPYFPEFGDQTYNPVDKEENDRIYALEQKQRYHERQMRKWDRTKQIQKAGGQDTKTATQWKNYHEKQIEEVIKESGVLKRDYSAEKGYAPAETINIPDGGKQEYRSTRIDKSSEIQITSKSTGVSKAYKMEGLPNCYVEQGIHIKPKEFHKINKELKAVYEKMGIQHNENLPTIIIVSHTNLSTEGLADYNAVNNTLKIFNGLGIIERCSYLLKEEERGDSGTYAMYEVKSKIGPADASLTYAHEMYHWKDAQDYIKEHGQITAENYLQYIDGLYKKHKKYIDDLAAKGYNVNRISSYAYRKMLEGNYDEAWTEYRAIKVFGGELAK